MLRAFYTDFNYQESRTVQSTTYLKKTNLKAFYLGFNYQEGRTQYVLLAHGQLSNEQNHNESIHCAL